MSFIRTVGCNLDLSSLLLFIDFGYSGTIFFLDYKPPTVFINPKEKAFSVIKTKLKLFPSEAKAYTSEGVRCLHLTSHCGQKEWNLWECLLPHSSTPVATSSTYNGDGVKSSWEYLGTAAEEREDTF